MGHGSILNLPHSSTPPLYHLYITSHRHYQPKNSTNPSNHNIMSWRHVKTFFTIHIDLLWDIVVTFATSHWLRSPLKTLVTANTVARKEGRSHSKLTRKKKRRRNPDQNTVTAQRRQTLFNHYTSLHQPKPRMNLLKSQENVQATLHHVTLRIDLMYAFWWQESDNFHINPYIYQRTRTFFNHHNLIRKYHR